MTISKRLLGKRRCLDSDFATNGQRVDNSLSTIQNLYELYQTSELCDVQLRVGPRLFNAHKLILSLSSDVFKTMLTDAKWPDASQACIVLSEEPECVEVFGEFLKYIYTGSIFLTNAIVLPVRTLADKYNLYELGKECRHYMATHCHAALPDVKVVSWHKYAKLCNDVHLESTIQHYMELNFSHVMQSEDFLTMDEDTLEKLLSCPHLVIQSELSLFIGLKNWFYHYKEMLREMVLEPWCSPASAQKKAGPAVERRVLILLMSFVRFPIMKHAQLLLLYSDPLVEQYADFFFPKLHAALSVQLYPHHREGLGTCDTTDAAAVPGVSSDLSQNVSTDCSQGPPCRRILFPQESDSNSLQSQNQSDKMGASRGVCHPSVAGSCQHTPRCAERSKHTEESSHQPSSGSQALLDMPLSSLAGHTVSDLTKEDPAYCTPRNYTCDDWSTCLTIEDFPSFPSYGSHAYFFSTPASAIPSSPCHVADRRENHEDGEDSALLEWQVELHPRGIRFPRAKMISIPDNYDIDENCRDVVRLALNSKTQHQQPCRVDVIVLALACGLFDGTEYVETLSHRTCIFDEQHTVHNLDNIVNFWVLNHAGSRYLTDSLLFPGRKSSCFKLRVIIKPRV